MVEYESNNTALDRLFGALSDGTRRAILRRLTTTPECCVTELAEPFDLSLNAVSKHLKVLERAGLITRTRRGRSHHCSANFTTLEPALSLLNGYRAFWEDKFDALEDFVAQDNSGLSLESAAPEPLLNNEDTSHE